MTPTAAQLRQLFPKGKKTLIDAIVRNWPSAVEAGVKTARDTQYFLATVGVETAGLDRIAENLNYTTAARIYEVFRGDPKKPRFRNAAACQPYVRQPEKLANFVYANRLGNGPPSSGDGFAYRGSGFFQTTGRYNFRKAGYEANPDALRDPDAGFLAACEFWTRNKLGKIAASGDTAAFRKAVNGGSHGLAEFRIFLASAQRIFKAQASPALGLTSAIAQASTVEEVAAEAAEPEITVAELKPKSSIARVNSLAQNATGTAGGVGILGTIGAFFVERYGDAKEALQPITETFEAIPGSVYFLIILALLGLWFWQSRFTVQKRLEMERTGESLTSLKAREAELE